MCAVFMRVLFSSIVLRFSFGLPRSFVCPTILFAPSVVVKPSLTRYASK